MVNFNDVKGEWVHRKTGKRVDVVSMNPVLETLGLRHESGRQSDKALHYFIEEYVRPESQGQPKTCGKCVETVEIGAWGAETRTIELCPRHASVDSLYEAAKVFLPICIRDGCEQYAIWINSMTGLRLCDDHKKDSSYIDSDAEALRAAIKEYEQGIK
jgi:hypothetical protein